MSGEVSSAFWVLEQSPAQVALVDQSGLPRTYATLGADADRVADLLPHEAGRTVGFILFETGAEAVATYLGALRSGGHVPLLLQPNISAPLLDSLIDAYAPDWILGGPGRLARVDYCQRQILGNCSLYVRAVAPAGPSPHPDCGLLLSTSGTTGSPKLVRLSYRALAHNARAIAEYLELTPSDRAITTLPLSYSFGMSILNSHLAVGGSLALTRNSPVTRDFWSIARASEITSLSGVPSTFEMLRRMGIEKQGLRRLRMLTQAGGRLRDELLHHFAGLAEEQGWRFIVMYGQTEAAPRISYLPPDRLVDKVGSIGIPIPGGALDIDRASGELVYRGPNVMMGYALSRDDLAKPDECAGILRTGDLARRDDEGFYYLEGRLKRFVKLSGNRVNLDELEAALTRMLGAQMACTGHDDRLVVIVPGNVSVNDGQVHAVLRDIFNIFAGIVHVVRVSELPTLSNGKLDYRSLENVIASPSTGSSNAAVHTS
jgi:acyl-coenzyme A synthetase/AMP-(fatty) acid ligase